MSEFTEKLIASVLKENNQGYLILKNCWSLFDSNIGVGGVSHSFNIVIRPENGQETISEESIKPENISFYSPDKGYKIKLSTETFNNVSSQVNRYNGKFETIVREYTTADNKVNGNPVEFATSIEGDLSLILDSYEPEAQYVNGPAAAKSSAAASTSNESLFSGVSQEVPLNQSAASAGASKKKSILLPVLGGLLALLLILLGVLWWLGVFSSADKEEPVTAPVENTQSADNQKEQENTAQNEENKSEENKIEEPAKSEDNQTPQNEPENTAANSTETPAADNQSSAPAAASASSACTLSSDADDVIITNCLGSNPTVEVINTLSEQSLENDRCVLGKRLLSSYGRKESSAAYLFAKYFDPNSSAQSKCIEKDKTQAVYWYQKAADMGMAEAKDAMVKLKE
ncbi:MAG: SEL1-like repeat protein [Succinivibrio sp.]|nr:SEL1-like repeat protein [Succinivibrio sp.]